LLVRKTHPQETRFLDAPVFVGEIPLWLPQIPPAGGQGLTRVGFSGRKILNSILGRYLGDSLPHKAKGLRHQGFRKKPTLVRGARGGRADTGAPPLTGSFHECATPEIR